MMKQFYLSTLLMAALFFCSCGESPQTNDVEPTPPQPTPPTEEVVVEVDAPANVSSMDGNGRVKLRWKIDAASAITSTLVYDGKSNSYKEYPFSAKANSGMQLCEAIIEGLNEGEHTFQLSNRDKDGNESDLVTISAKAYGEEYLSTLTTRPVSTAVYDRKNRTATIHWQEDWALGIASEVTYKSESGSSNTVWVENSTTETEIQSIAENTELTIHSLYQPDNCMDVIYSTPTTITPEAPPVLDIKVMQLNVATGNILTALTGMSHQWSSRRPKMVEMIKQNDIDFVGLQELRPSPHYFNELLNDLGSDYGGLFYERSSSDKEGLGIIYRSDRFELVSEGRYWLNMTDPDRELKLSNGGYDANYYRIAVWAILREKNTQQEFYFTTAHLDNNDAGNGIIKTWQAQILINHTNAKSGYDKGLNRFIIVTGDMNSNPEREAMQRFTSTTQNYIDTWSAAASRSCPDPSKPRSTMVDIDGDSATQNNACFDYIYAKAGNPQVLSHTIHSAISGNVIMSDHNAVSTLLRYELSK